MNVNKLIRYMTLLLHLSNTFLLDLIVVTAGTYCIVECRAALC